MDIEEARKKFGISVPSDREFYSDEYIEYFRENKTGGEFEKYRQFQEMFNKSFITTFFNRNTEGRTIADRKAVVLGGQAGAGKSSLVYLAKQEAHAEGREIFLIDDDMYRIFYPNALQLWEECPEHYVAITAIGSATVTPKIMRYASENGMNFIFDGTMKSPRIIDTAMSWKDYDINWKVMGTSKLESLISIFERNEALRRNGKGRLTTVDVHNEIYTGIGPTLMQLESMGDMGRIQVYSRGQDIFAPVLQYDSQVPGSYSSAHQALEDARRKDAERCKKNGVQERIDNLKNTPIPLNEAERKALKELEESIKAELQER